MNDESMTDRALNNGVAPVRHDGPDSKESLPEDVIDAAIIWAVKLDYNDPPLEARRAFERWLQSDPLHALAWARVSTLKQPFANLPSKVLRTTLAAADTMREQRLSSRRSSIKLLSLAGLALGACWLAREHTPWQRLLADASTTTGEIKTLRLADGTVIVLNTDSAVSADTAGQQRRVILRRGEILVTTGHDADAPARRPFWVYTPFGKLQALGTRFTVRLEKRRARISVQEGAVELHPAGSGASHLMRAGESRWLSDDSTAPADLRGFQPDSWTDGVVAGQNIRLADLLDELSRYRSGRITCNGRVADLRLSGLFRTQDTDQTLRFLAQAHALDVAYRTPFWVVVGPAAER